MFRWLLALLVALILCVAGAYVVAGRGAPPTLAIEKPDQAHFRVGTPAGIKEMRLIVQEGNEYLFEMNMGKVKVLELQAIVQGQDVVSKISRAPVRGDKPVDPVKLITVKIERFGPEPVKKPKK